MGVLGRVLASALCGVLVGVGAPVSGAAAEDPCVTDLTHTPLAGPIFNDPKGSREDEYRIVDEINRNIIGAAPGSVVRIATLELGLPGTTDLLINAARCGVQVRVVLPGRVRKSPEAVRLRAALGSDVTADSYLTTCSHSCLTDRPKGVMHVKSYLFSETWGQKDVTMYSSANLVRSQAESVYNDAYQLVGDAAVHEASRKYFDKLRRDRTTKFRKVVSAGVHRLYFFPTRTGGFHNRILANTSCDSSQGPTRVELSASIWSRAGVARRLASLHDQGCDVRVQFNKDKVTPKVMRILLRRGVATQLQSKAAGEVANHSKYIAISGTHYGEETNAVYSGSLNITPLSEIRSDNHMMRIQDPDTTAAYHRQFEETWHESRPLTRSDVRDAEAVRVGRAEARD